MPLVLDSRSRAIIESSSSRAQMAADFPHGEDEVAGLRERIAARVMAGYDVEQAAMT
jgi:hypothetical protein